MQRRKQLRKWKENKKLLMMNLEKQKKKKKQPRWKD